MVDTTRRALIAAIPGAAAAGPLAASILAPPAARDSGRMLDRGRRDVVSLLDFIPEHLHADIKRRISTTDVSPFIQNAEDHLHGWGGGLLHFPAGWYHATAQITKRPFVSWLGDGPQASAIFWPLTYSVHGVRMDSGLNGGRGVRMAVTGIGFARANATGTVFNPANSHGAGWYDTGSHEFTFQDCNFAGWKYGCILDQSEVIQLYDCNFTRNLDGLWLVNSEELELGNLGAAAGVTNRIAVRGGHIHQRSLQYPRRRR